MAQFYFSLKAREFPVRWSGGYGNFGQPLPLYAHQFTSYAGGLLTFIFQDPEISYKILFLLSAIASTLLLYSILIIYAPPQAALLGSLFFNVGAYRIVNIYTRGALPEFFAVVWILLVIRVWLVQRSVQWLSLVGALLLLTHPLIAIITLLSTLLVVPKKSIIPLGISLIIAGLIASYYLIPLVLESKYLYLKYERPSVSFVSLQNYFMETWDYFGQGHPGPRPNVIQFGLSETLILILGLSLIKNVPIRRLLIVTGIMVILTLPLSDQIYKLVPYLGSIQYAYRWFTLLSLVPPVVLVFILNKYPRFSLVVSILISIIVVFRASQAYGKNYYHVPLTSYLNTVATLHTANFNTIWMGDWRDYPPQTTQSAIIEGKGNLETIKVTNTARHYHLTAQTDVRLVDYTFYFPGWSVFADGKELPIEFQDPQYRGIITYRIPPGEHDLRITFTETKTRRLANYLSVLGLLGLAGVSIHSLKVVRGRGQLRSLQST